MHQCHIARAFLASLYCVTIFTCLVVTQGGCGEKVSKDALERQRSFVESSGFLLSSSGKAVDDYVDSINLLKKGRLTQSQLKHFIREPETVPAEILEVLDQATECILRGARKRRSGIPKIPPWQFYITIGSERVETSDFVLAVYSCTVVVNTLRCKKEYERSILVAKALVAMGLHLGNSDHKGLHAIGIACKQYGLRAIRDNSVAKGDSELTKHCDAMLSDIQEEFLTMAKRKE